MTKSIINMKLIDDDKSIKTWTIYFTLVINFLKLIGYYVKPNVQILKLLTFIYNDKIIYYNSNSFENKKKFFGEWVWNKKIISNYKLNDYYIFYIHGGAFCSGNTYNFRGFLYEISTRTNYVIFSSNYRKSPEFKNPIPLNDCIKSYEYFLSKIKNLKAKIIIMGDSTGGNLSINLISHLIKSNKQIPNALILISPWVDLCDPGISSSWIENSKYDFIRFDYAKLCTLEYINKSITKLEDVSPTYLPNNILKKFPLVLIEYGEYELLRDQIDEFIIKLKKLGVDVTDNCRYEMIHDFPIFYMTKIPQAEDFFISVENFTKKVNKIN